jgi:hypothetical protein
VFFSVRQVFPPASSTLSKPSRAAPNPFFALRWSNFALLRPLFLVLEREDLAEALPAPFFLAVGRFLLPLRWADFRVAAMAASALA